MSAEIAADAARQRGLSGTAGKSHAFCPGRAAGGLRSHVRWNRRGRRAL